MKQSSTEGFGTICSNFQVKQASANVTNSKMVRYCSEGNYHMQLENNLRTWFRIFMIPGREFDSRLCLSTSERNYRITCGKIRVQTSYLYTRKTKSTKKKNGCFNLNVIYDID